MSLIARASMRTASRRIARDAAPHSRTFITAAGFNFAKKLMPKMSETEKIALGAGTVGFEKARKFRVLPNQDDVTRKSHVAVPYAHR